MDLYDYIADVVLKNMNRFEIKIYNDNKLIKALKHRDLLEEYRESLKSSISSELSKVLRDKVNIVQYKEENNNTIIVHSWVYILNETELIKLIGSITEKVEELLVQ